VGKFFNIFAAPSDEGLHLDGEKIQARFNYFFHLWDNFSKICASPSAGGLYSNGKKAFKHDLIFFSICGINLSNIFAAPSAEGLC